MEAPKIDEPQAVLFFALQLRDTLEQYTTLAIGFGYFTGRKTAEAVNQAQALGSIEADQTLILRVNRRQQRRQPL